MILDTNALSAWKDDNRALLSIMDPGRLALPVITIGEFAYGIARSRERDETEAWLSEIVRSLPVLNVTIDTAAAYSRIRVMLRKAGRPMPSNDMWIAALAVEHDLPVLSRDTHFDAVDGLRRISW